MIIPCQRGGRARRCDVVAARVLSDRTEQPTRPCLARAVARMPYRGTASAEPRPRPPLQRRPPLAAPGCPVRGRIAQKARALVRTDGLAGPSADTGEPPTRVRQRNPGSAAVPSRVSAKPPPALRLLC